MRAHLWAIAILVGAIAVSSAAAGGAAESKRPFQLTSSIDGKKVLPLRLRWLAYPKVAAREVAEVAFLIDGRVRWIEHRSPYNYGSDDFHGHLGFLITTWLEPGLHHFTARATLTDGRRATRSVLARVLPAPQPPTSLAGMWTRIVKTGPGPIGRWNLFFDRVGAWELDPKGSGHVDEVAVARNTLHLYAPIQMAPLIDNHTTISRFGHTNIGGFDCREDGPFGRYHWRVAHDRLVLTLIREGCAGRGTLWHATWTRVAPAGTHRDLATTKEMR